VANVVFLLVLVVVVSLIVSTILRNRRGIVAERGMSIGADLGVLADTPKARVRTVEQVGPDRVHLVLAPETGLADVNLVVSLGVEEFGFGVLEGWEAAGSLVAVVMPPDTRIVRLRSVDDLQQLTLRRADTEGPASA
jgi:hypothetical protein